jgi:hypothetical protein
MKYVILISRSYDFNQKKSAQRRVKHVQNISVTFKLLPETEMLQLNHISLIFWYRCDQVVHMKMHKQEYTRAHIKHMRYFLTVREYQSLAARAYVSANTSTNIQKVIRLSALASSQY